MASELEEDLVFCPASVYQYVCVQEWFCPRAGNFLFPCRGAAFLVLFSLSRHICFEGQPGKEKVWQPLSTIDKKEIGMITPVLLFLLFHFFFGQTGGLEFYIQAKSSFMCSHAWQLNKRQSHNCPKKCSKTFMILAWKTQFHMACKKGQFDVVELMLNNQFQGF